ncbi:hypothetical protein [Peterkaempfera sp. SMS 1(5)a]|uniref:hypothetical protein n=1 Tax=Peterkaempfera podocarpi TaxID=3232308 RepID=UPI00367012A7
MTQQGEGIAPHRDPAPAATRTAATRTAATQAGVAQQGVAPAGVAEADVVEGAADGTVVAEAAADATVVAEAEAVKAAAVKAEAVEPVAVEPVADGAAVAEAEAEKAAPVEAQAVQPQAVEAEAVQAAAAQVEVAPAVVRPAEGHAEKPSSPRIWAALAGVIVVGLGAALWVDSSDGGILGSSQDATGTGAVAGPGPASASSAAPDAFSVERYFPADRAIDEDASAAHRTAFRQGAACSDVVQGATATRLGRIGGCEGYIGATYTRADGAVLTTVTVLRFSDDTRAHRAAALLRTKAGDVSFDLPDDLGQDVVPPVPPTAEAQFSRVAAVQDYVTVTSSAFRDGNKPTGPEKDELADATRAVAHTAGSHFMWF